MWNNTGVQCQGNDRRGDNCVRRQTVHGMKVNNTQFDTLTVSTPGGGGGDSNIKKGGG